MFRHGVRAARVTDAGRWALLDLSLAEHRPGASSRRTLSGPDEVLTVLDETFGIDVDEPGIADAVRRDLAREA